MQLSEWHEFFLATAGAAAGLVGLIIVAMSVNIETIVATKAMPSRAASTIASLVLIVVVAIAGLIPNLTNTWFGIVVLASGLAALYFAVESAVRIGQARDVSAIVVVVKSAVGIGPVLFFVASGLAIVAGAQSGLVVLSAGILLAFIASVLNAWVLLVEIRR